MVDFIGLSPFLAVSQPVTAFVTAIIYIYQYLISISDTVTVVTLILL